MACWILRKNPKNVYYSKLRNASLFLNTQYMLQSSAAIHGEDTIFFTEKKKKSYLVFFFATNCCPPRCRSRSSSSWRWKGAARGPAGGVSDSCRGRGSAFRPTFGKRLNTNDTFLGLCRRKQKDLRYLLPSTQNPSARRHRVPAVLKFAPHPYFVNRLPHIYLQKSCLFKT